MKFPSWHVAQENCAAAERLADAGYPYLVSEVLASRGVERAEDAAEFLTQETTLTYSPFLMQDMDKAVERIAQERRSPYSETTMWTASPPPASWWTI